MLRRFAKWFAVAWFVQSAFVFLAISTGFLSDLALPYWPVAMLIGYGLGLPEKGTGSVILAFALATALASIPIGVLGMLLLKFPGNRN